ncbi:DUF4112 domain-containing protein [soil metagenome]
MTPRQSPTDEALRRWAVLLDSAFRIPGTNIRFGLDALVGLFPGFGDLASPLFTVALLLEGTRRRLPAVVQARMVLNAGIDMLLGLVPLLGDMADVAWKANLRNLALLERHARPGTEPGTGDYVFVFVCIGAVVLMALVPVLLVAWLITQVPRLV